MVREGGRPGGIGRGQTSWGKGEGRDWSILRCMPPPPPQTIIFLGDFISSDYHNAVFDGMLRLRIG